MRRTARASCYLLPGTCYLRLLVADALPDRLEAFAGDRVADLLALQAVEFAQDVIALRHGVVEAARGHARHDGLPHAGGRQGGNVLGPPDRRHLVRQGEARAHALEVAEALLG